MYNRMRSEPIPMTYPKIYTPECSIVTPSCYLAVKNIREIMGTQCEYYTEDEAKEFQESAITPRTKSIHYYPEIGNVPWHYELSTPETAVLLEKGFRAAGLFTSLARRVGELEELHLCLAIHGYYPTKEMDAVCTQKNIEEIMAGTSEGTDAMVREALMSIYKKIAPTLKVTITEDEIGVEELPVSQQPENGGLVDGEVRLDMKLIEDLIASGKLNSLQFS